MQAVSRLKEQVDGEIVIPASHELGHTLMEHGLVDEVRLVIFPVVIGAGKRFFDVSASVDSVRLADSRTVGDGLVMLTYQLSRRDLTGDAGR